MSDSGSVIDREKQAIAAHRATFRGSDLPPLGDALHATFLHGFLLPFTLIVATMRDRELRGPYLRVAFVRALIVTTLAIAAMSANSVSVGKAKPANKGIVIHTSSDGGHKPTKPIHVAFPGISVNIGDADGGEPEVTLFGQKIPVSTVTDGEGDVTLKTNEASDRSTLQGRVTDGARRSWAWLLGLITVLSALELIVVFFSRHWDDWLSFHASSRLASILPEDATPRTPKLGFDLGWLYRKSKRRLRGYFVFAAGLPLLFPLRFVPSAGPWLFTLAATLWGWYWLGVFSAAKSAHSWADGEQALAPTPIRVLTDRAPRNFLFAPLRWYGRFWRRLSRTLNPAAATFERSPAAFLGLALARVLLALPGVYLLARPIIPVAAGRLCAEADPTARFSIESMPA